jgi:hypothetical protein
MKKAIISLCATAVILTGVTSCKKIIDKIFNGIDARAPDYSIVIPPIPAMFVGSELPGTPVTSPFNLDSIIKANSGGTFGIADVKSVKVKSITLNVPDADANNRLGNFESTKVRLNSNTNSDFVEFASFTFADTATRSMTVIPANPPELLPYLRGSEVTYQSIGKARRPTTKSLTFIVSLIIRVE